jgi:hypothetical protein
MSVWLVAAFAACVGFGPGEGQGDVTDEAGVPEAIQAVERLGGTVLRDEKDPRRPVVTVELGGSPFEDFPTRQLECLWRFKYLRALSLTGGCFRDAHLQTISSITSLERLQVMHAGITDEGLRHLRRLHNLKALELPLCWGVTDEGLKDIGSLPRLDSLRLESGNVTGAGFKHFKCKSRLRKVDLMKCWVTDEGLRELAEFPELEELILTCDYAVTDKGIQQLSPLKHLRELAVSDTQVTRDGAEELRRSLPDLLIVY